MCGAGGAGGARGAGGGGAGGGSGDAAAGLNDCGARGDCAAIGALLVMADVGGWVLMVIILILFFTVLIVNVLGRYYR